MATIITKNSQTASAVPSAASLEVGELAVNTADGKLYTEHTGGVVKEIIPSTVSDGGITTAKIADNAVTEAKIADGAVTTNKLSNSGVTAGTYTIATVTVDAKGRVTSASSGSSGAPTTAQVLSATAGASVGAVGTYAFCKTTADITQSPGTTRAGSGLRYSDVVNGNGSSPAGTWQLMGGSGGSNSFASVWLRIS